jgi:hypothetical protein
MKTFYEWLDKKDLWIDLYFYLLEADSPGNKTGIYNDKNYHANLVRKLRVLGLGEDADELEVIRISDSDINFSKSPLDSSIQDSSQKRNSARLAYNTYMDHIENLIKKTKEYIDKMGWSEDVEKQFDSRMSNHPGKEDYDQYGI